MRDGPLFYASIPELGGSTIHYLGCMGLMTRGLADTCLTEKGYMCGLARYEDGVHPRYMPAGYCSVSSSRRAREGGTAEGVGDHRCRQAVACSKTLEPRNAIQRQNARVADHKKSLWVDVADKTRAWSEQGCELGFGCVYHPLQGPRGLQVVWDV